MDAEGDYRLEFGVRVPMRDGVGLAATLYLPGSGEPCPFVFILTPYVGDRYHRLGAYFTRFGYAFASVDCRGRGGSGGEFLQWTDQEGDDGYDTVEWLARHPGCDGRVVAWGGSYGGTVQWLAARRRPPSLMTIVPTASGYPGEDYPGFRSILYSYLVQYLALVGSSTPNVNLFADQKHWVEVFRRHHLSLRPFRELARSAGSPEAPFQRLLGHPHPDAGLKALAPSPEEYRAIGLPVLTITGQYDGDQAGALRYYREHLRHAPASRDRHYLVIGPWDHAGTGLPGREVGGLTFGPASEIDMFHLHVEWYDWWLKGGPRPPLLEKRVAYYVLGAEEWRHADDLDAIADRRFTLHLDSRDGEAGDAFHSGFLHESEASSAMPDSFTYDPLDTRYAEQEVDDEEVELTTQRPALNLFGNGLVYHSAQFEEELDLVGQPLASLWLEIDVPDTDFVVSLSELRADGSHILLGRDLIRARHRLSDEREDFARPGAVEEYRFDRFPFVARRLGRRSRLRLLVQCPHTIHLQRNFNGGGIVADEGANEARVAHVRLHHDPRHPSRLELPIEGRRDGKEKLS